MARLTKNIEAFCRTCATVTKMEIATPAGEAFGEEAYWAKCKKCKNKLVITLDDIVRDDRISVKNIDMGEAVDYSPDRDYEIGSVLFHQGWEDFGVVKSKSHLSATKISLTVEFQSKGIKKLLASTN